MGVGDAFTCLKEQVEPLADGELVVVGKARHRNAGNVIHDKVRTAQFIGTGVENLGDIGMIHARQRLSLRLETSEHLLRTQAGTDQLYRDDAFDRRSLLGFVDGAHAALSEFFPERDRDRHARAGHRVRRLRGSVRKARKRGFDGCNDRVEMTFDGNLRTASTH